MIIAFLFKKLALIVLPLLICYPRPHSLPYNFDMDAVKSLSQNKDLRVWSSKSNLKSLTSILHIYWESLTYKLEPDCRF